MQYTKYMSKELSALVVRYENVCARLQVLDFAMRGNARDGFINERARRGYREILSACLTDFDLLHCELSDFSACLDEKRVYQP